MTKSRFDGVQNLNSPEYTPVRLINEVAFKLKAQTDNQLSIMLQMDTGQMSRIRHRKEMVSHRMIVNILDRTDWTIKHVRELMGVPFQG